MGTKAPFKFEYKERTPDATKKRATQQGGMFDSYINERFSTFNPKEGDNIGRILPPTWDNPEHFGLDVWLHSNIGADKNTYLCARKMKNESCCICDEMDQAKRESDDKYADALKPYRRVLVWWIDRNKEKEGPKPYPMPWTMDRDFSNGAVDKRTQEVLVIDHPYDGYDVEFTRNGTGLNTKYVSPAVARRSTPLSDDDGQMEEWLKLISENPLPSILVYFDQDYIKKVFAGQIKPDDKADPKTGEGSKGGREEAAPPPRTRNASTKEEAPPPPRSRPKIDNPDEDLDSPPQSRSREAARTETPFRPPAASSKQISPTEEPPARTRVAPPADDEDPPVRTREVSKPAEAPKTGLAPLAARPAPPKADDDDAPPPPRAGRARPNIEDDD